MPDWRKDERGTERVDVLLFERFSNHCLANALEPFRAANAVLRHPAYAWRILTHGDARVTSSSGLPVLPTASLADQPRGTLLMVLPSYGYRAFETPPCLAMLRAAASRYDTMAGLDTGSWLMAAAGLLDGCRATIHDDEFDAFAERFPDVRAERQRWIADGARLTCGGASAAFEMVLDRIGATHGMATSLEVAALFLAPAPPAALGHSAPIGDRIVRAALARMATELEAPVPIAAVARDAGVGSRELSRRFVRALGASPGTAYRRMRLLAARRMVEGGAMSVAEIAARTGYTDASAFTRAFRREFGAPPRALR